MRDDIIYQGSDGRFHGEADLWEAFEAGTWTPCCWDENTGKEWIETDDGTLLLLIPIPRRALPDGLHIQQDVDGLRITGKPNHECSSDHTEGESE